MGKNFYGTHADKNTAMKLADHYAKHYKKGKCWTPASRVKKCTYDKVKKLWTCKACAHHHWGSCGTHEITSPHQRGSGSEWSVTLPPITFSEIQEAIPIDNQNLSHIESVENDEIYIDALPEDYVDGPDEV